MANYDSIASCIRQAFDDETTGWPALQPDIPYFFDGQEVIKDAIEDSTWVRLSIQFGAGNQVAMGGGTSGRRVRTVGIAVVQIFKPTAEGRGELYRLADSVASIWQVSTISGIRFRASDAQPVQIDGPWAIQNVSTPFQADEYVT